MSRDAEASAWFARMRGPDADQHRHAFEAWRRDPGNAAAYADAEADWLLVGGVAPAHIEGRGPARTAGRAAPMRWALAAIVAAAISIGFAWHLIGNGQQPQVAERSVRDGDLHLADGSTVWLADGARAEIRFGPRERRILLFGGRGTFEVAHDAARPFVVEGGGSETTALGTRFTVDLRQTAVIVELARGAVEVRATGTVSSVRLAPGQRARVEDRQARVVPPAQETAISPVIDAEAVPLTTIVEKANAVNARPIRLADPALGTLEITGRFDVSDSSKLARKLAAAFDLAMETTIDAIILSAKDKKTGE